MARQQLNEPLDLFVSTGELSGDELAASVLSHLPDTLKIRGIIGPKLRALGVEELFPMELFEVHGLFSLLKALPRIIFYFRKIRQTILQLQPKVVLLVDNAEFSLLMAKSLKKHGFQGKIIQLVCPTVWAWRKGRKKTMIKTLDGLLSLFPFERDLFQKTPLQAHFIGHPLIDRLRKIKNQPKGNLFALFPGSRWHEVKLNLPLQLRVARHLQPEYEIAIGVAQPRFRPLIEKMAAHEGVKVRLVDEEDRYTLMQEAKLALAKCGTTILELGVIGTPTIVMYKMARLETMLAFLANIHLPHYSLPNLILQRRIFPEYIALYAKENLILDEVLRCAKNPSLRNAMTSVSKDLLAIYGTQSACKEAALHLMTTL